MRAVVMNAFREPMTVEDLPDPACPKNGVIVETGACGICRSDWHSWTGHWPEGVPFPAVLGHEFAGRVVEVGAEVRRVKRDDRVVIPFCGGCGYCEWCIAGLHHVCDEPFQPGFATWGGFGQLVPVLQADINCIPLPDTIDFLSAAAMGCRFMTSFQGLTGAAELQAGEWVAVHGSGGIGLSAVMIASALGAQVIAIDIDSEKLDFAKRLGAIHGVNASNCDPAEAIREITAGGAQVSIDALGIEATCRNSVRSLRKRGRHVQIGITSPEQKGEVSMPVDDIMSRELRIIGSHGMPLSGYGPLIKMVAAGKLRPAELVTRTVTLEETWPILSSMENYATTGFVVIDRYQ
jgi:D-arabinose 1-dehydrogenase-like Zn-dependent alcohol dehydrogenase